MCHEFVLGFVTPLVCRSSPDLSVMEVNAIPSFSSKDEEINFWKSLSIKYRNRLEADIFFSSLMTVFGFMEIRLD